MKNFFRLYHHLPEIKNKRRLSNHCVASSKPISEFDDWHYTGDEHANKKHSKKLNMVVLALLDLFSYKVPSNSRNN